MSSVFSLPKLDASELLAIATDVEFAMSCRGDGFLPSLPISPAQHVRLLRVCHFISSEKDKVSIDGLGFLMEGLAAPPAKMSIGQQNLYVPRLWGELKREIKLLICTRDKKYKDLRKKLATSADKSHTTIVSTISAAMAVHYGVSAGLLVPFVALCLVALVRIGKEAFCATVDWDFPPSSSIQNAQGKTKRDAEQK
jgi:hypothetical protein